MINPEEHFKIIHVETLEHESIFSCFVPTDLPYFQGHFKDNPVLPAVALLDLSLAIINSLDSSLKRTFLTIKTAKFSEVIRPLDTLTIRMKSDLPNQSWNLDFFNQNEALVSKLNVQTT
jgi:3-hydroxymyristoyl/3-hydroxydecanoyl-(acyl carrier protein) dehydratase